MPNYDALLLVSFGGPEGPEDVMPFLENVTRGKRVPPERLAEVAEHYAIFDGISPINEQARALLMAIITELNSHGPALAVYWANRFWHPMLPEVVEQMANDGVQRALALCTSAFGSYPGCRAYREDIDAARAAIGDAAPVIDKLRLFYNHPGFIDAMADRVAAAVAQVKGANGPAPGPMPRLVFTAHSLPQSMAENSPYEAQLREACRLVAERVKFNDWRLAYQSRSGRPSDTWLEPTLEATLTALAAEGTQPVVIAPIGFAMEHMEVVYDLDIEAAARCEQLGLEFERAGTVAGHPRFTAMVRELILERFDPNAPRLICGDHGPCPDLCNADCCRPLT